MLLLVTSILTIFLYLFGSVMALRYNKKLKKQGFKGISTAECFNPKKWFSVFIGYLFKFLIPQHVFEQYVLRFYDPECRPLCMLKGPCDVCGCDAIAKGWSYSETCSKGNWPRVIFNKKEYEEFRKNYPVKIEIKYGPF